MGRIQHFMRQACDDASARQPLGVAAYLARFVLVTGVYYLVAVISLSFTVRSGIISPFWPPAAIGLCACLKWKWRIAPAIWLGSLLAIWSAGLSPWVAALIGLGRGLEAPVAAFLVLRWYHRRRDFIYQQNIFKFVGITGASSVIGASIGIAALTLTGQRDMAALSLDWFTWWVGDATGMIVGAPLLLTWQQGIHSRWNGAKLAEAIVFALLLPVVTNIAFGDVFGRWPFSYLPIPFIIWAAFRFNLATVTWTIAAICAITVWNTVQGNGPFSGGDLNTSLLLLMIYIGILGTIGLALASLLYQRKQAEKKLIAERDELEQRVEERTEALRADIEERKHVEQQLDDAQHLSQIGSWNWDIGSGKITWSDELYRINGVHRETFALTPARCRGLIHPDDMGRIESAVAESLHSGKPFHTEHRILLPSGTVKTISSHGNVLKDEAGQAIRLFGTMQDVTETKLAEAALRDAEERYRMVVELSPDAILVQQDGVIVFANPAASMLLHAAGPEQIVGKSLFDLLHPDCHKLTCERIAALQRGDTLQPTEKKFVRLDGVTVDFEVNSSPFRHKGRFATLYIMRDITERKKTIAAMVYLAHYDSLTGLPNRMLFQQRLEHALSIAQRPGRSLEILFLDLDRFKNINDTLGHAAGDLVLRETATRLQGILRESDTVARLGGDEFVVLVENVDEPHRGGVIAEKILAALQPPFMREREPLTITTSIGISSYPSDGIDAETLLKKADIAMYRAKEMGRNNYRYYSVEMNLHTAERLSLEYALSHAIEQNQLSLHYQPKVDMLTNRITGMEALLRWQHPTLGSVPPGRFIPVAEEAGLIGPIGYWALRAACTQNKLWQEASPARLKVAVNLSPRQLTDERLIDNIREILDTTGLAARYLELEITETAIMTNPDKAIVVLNALRDMGLSVAIDDFGIGYSSLSYLNRFPIRAVKIDQSFVQGIPNNPGDAAITRAIISLAHSLECSVIAEGAETQQQYDFLREHDCDSVQGYYFSEPMNAEMFGDLIRAQSHLHLH